MRIALLLLLSLFLVATLALEVEGDRRWNRALKVRTGGRPTGKRAHHTGGGKKKGRKNKKNKPRSRRDASDEVEAGHAVVKKERDNFIEDISIPYPYEWAAPEPDSANEMDLDTSATFWPFTSWGRHYYGAGRPLIVQGRPSYFSGYGSGRRGWLPAGTGRRGWWHAGPANMG